jgi:hypothetical protein
VPGSTVASMDVALGLRPHSGWAAAVAVGGDAAEPAPLDRRRLALADVPPPVQPYHEAADLPPADAASLVEEATVTAFARAAAELAAVVGSLRDAGHRVVGAGIVAAAGSVREDLPLERTLAAHSTLHAAEGELYRDALADAAADLGLPVTLVGPRETASLGRRLFGLGDAALSARLTQLGRPFGPPWTRDHKDALVAALAVLADRVRSG